MINCIINRFEDDEDISNVEDIKRQIKEKN